MKYVFVIPALALDQPLVFDTDLVDDTFNQTKRLPNHSSHLATSLASKHDSLSSAETYILYSPNCWDVVPFYGDT